MINQEQIDKHLSIYVESGKQAAMDFATGIIVPLSTSQERSDAGRVFRDSVSVYEKERARKIAREARANKASIKKTVEQILEKGGQSGYETKFLNDIKTKRKLTEKQEKWLRDLAEKANISIKGAFSNRVSRSFSNHYNHCEHEDLGSLGFNHGDTVKCPHCGTMCQVW